MPASLGTLEREFRPHRAFFVLSIAGALFLIALGALIAYAFVGIPETPRPSGLDQWSALVVLVAGTLGLGLLWLVLLIAQWPYRIRLYTAGVEVRATWWSTRAISDDSIATLRYAEAIMGANGIVLGRVSDLWLVSNDGRTLRLRGRGYGWDLAPIAEAVLARTFARRLERRRHAADRGDALRFGPIVVARDGLRIGDRRLPWSDFGGARIADGRLHCHRTDRTRFGPRLGLMLASIDDCDVLLALLRERVAAQG